MLNLTFQYFDQLMWRADSLEKILMLGKIEGRRRREWHRMRRLDGITDSMDISLGKLQEMVKDKEACCVAGHGLQSWIWLSDWTTKTITTILWWSIPYMDMNRPRVYICLPILIPLPPPSPFYLSRLFQSTGFGCPASCIELALVIYFTSGNMHVSVQFSQIIPPSPFSTESKSLFFTSVSLLLPCVFYIQ